MPKKTTLQFKEGTSDKTYEVWLEATPSGKSYKVNFAYGRTGGNLKAATKTPRAVALEKAEEVFEKLVAEKKKKG
jgi:predicted DNA-binding WGR domain protein